MALPRALAVLRLVLEVGPPLLEDGHPLGHLLPLLALLGTAACLSYANPFSNQSFILVMGPGRSSFGEFVRLGLPVSVVALALAVTGAMAWLWILG